MNSPKRFLFLGLVLMILASAACRRDQDLLTGQPQVTPEAPLLTPEQIKSIGMCLTVDPADLPATTDTVYGSSEVGERAAGERYLFWDRGAVLKVKLIGATPVVRELVKYYAKEWSMHANVGFDFVTSGYAHIRVTFDPEDGNWSKIGVRASYYPQDEPTMNLAINDFTNVEEVRRYTLHEFGHALGLVHEHQQPLANIPWNEPMVYSYFLLTQGWSMQETDQNIFFKYEVDDAFYTSHDKYSIMHYAVDPVLTIGGYAVPWNTQLSAKDKSFIHQMYTTVGITITHKYEAYDQDIRFKVNGIWYILGKDEAVKVYIPNTGSPMTLSMQESNNGLDWFWDTNHSVQYNKNYKIVQDGNSGCMRFKLVQVP